MARQQNIDPTVAARILDEISRDKMGGWLDLPLKVGEEQLKRIKLAAAKINQEAKFLVCIGVGGSYLGHRAVIEALRPKSPTKILYTGNSFSSRELQNVIDEIGDADFSILAISKSGETLETAIAYQIFKEKLIKKYGAENAKTRIYVTTDANSGVLHDDAIANNYFRFVAPNNIGGRYSVLTDVGMLPMAVAGVDISKLLQGARECREKQFGQAMGDSALFNYAFLRHNLYRQGTKIEVLASFEPSMMYFNEWWKQLFGESEGKKHSGLFPASVIYSTDLHSMGQYMQDGQRDILETFIRFRTPDAPAQQFTINSLNDISEGKIYNIDNLDSLRGKTLNFLNDVAFEATVAAHDAGGISTVVIEVFDDESNEIITARSLGFLIYFFETACALSAKLNGVNPFDQPGVETYKSKMRELINAPAK